MALKEQRESKNYISISSDGQLRKVVPEGTNGAVTREYETTKKGEDGNFIKGTKIEKYYESVSGKITDMSFMDTDYGTLLQVELTDGDEFLKSEPEVLSMSTSSDFAKDFMKKLPNMDLEKEIEVRPFSFIPEGKTNPIKGITIKQDGEKVEKSFVEKTETGITNIMGFPNPDAKLKDEKNEMKRKEGWKRYFKDCEIFLVDYTTENFVSKFNKDSVNDTLESKMMEEETELPEGFN